MAQDLENRHGTARVVAASPEIRRLRILLVVVFLALLAPISLLINHIYQRLEREQQLQLQSDAEGVITLVNQRMQELLEPEERRGFGEYSFFNLEENTLLNRSSITTSPLSQLPAPSGIPGLVGFFQIDPRGDFSSPVLPQLPDQLLASSTTYGLSPSELERRISLRDSLEATLLAGEADLGRFRGEVSSPGMSKAAPGLTEKRSAASKLISSLEDQERLSRRGDPAKASPPPSLEKKQLGESASGSSLANRANKDFYNESPLDGFEKAKSDGLDRLGGYDTDTAGGSGAADELRSGYRERRKERVLLPSQTSEAEVQQVISNLGSTTGGAGATPLEDQKRENTTIGNLTDRLAGPTSGDTALESGAVILEENLPTGSGSAVEGSTKRRGATPIIESFESELDPFRSAILKSGPKSGQLLFYRKVWRERQRYIQGFVVEPTQFFSKVAELVLTGGGAGQFRQIKVTSGSVVLFSTVFESSSSYPLRLTERKESATSHRGRLASPLAEFEIELARNNAPRTAGALLVDVLSGVILLVLSAGFIGIYRLARDQIILAQKRSDFVSAVSHELKTPLTSIRMYGEMLRSGWVEDEAKRRSYYDFIFFESERLSRLINNVLQLSRLAKSDATLELRAVSPQQVMDTVKSKVASLAATSGFAFEYIEPNKSNDIAGANPAKIEVELDQDAMIQIFINLVDNAIKFAAKSEPKLVQLGYRVQGSGVSFFVRDFGPGVPDDEMRKIFDLFYRVESELTRSTSGTGIGLALVKELATKMNGRVELKNCNPGAKFAVSFGASS